MNFISAGYFIFLAAVLACYWLLPQATIRRWFLILASYVFYSFWDWRFCGLMFFVTVNAYLTGHALQRPSDRSRKLTLALSIVVDLVMLAFFKYFSFLTSNLVTGSALLGLNLPVPVLDVILPIGISFYTFHAISYVVDVYRNTVPAEYTFSKVALYIAFFPQLIAGPIVRANFFMPQLLREPRPITAQQMNGVWLIARGFVYKSVLADSFAEVASPVFANVDQYRASALITALLCFYAQIYFDFAGYSGMAIGTARLFGYRIPKNFDFPYASTSVTDFWRRWHMSLSFWLRDYVYFPLGGSRGGEVARYRNLMITMLLGGLWHGASWNFVFWGFLHGIGLCAHKAWTDLKPMLLGSCRAPTVVGLSLGLVVTQLWVLGAWAFFRCDTFGDALTVLCAFIPTGQSTGRPAPTVGGWVVATVFADCMLGRLRLVRVHWDRWAQPILWAGLGVTAALALAAMPFARKAFIYFQF
jgi:alginate O-acetyltransferase complex protein AlgI